MPAREVTPEPIRAWVTAKGRSTTVEQYAAQVRRFFRDRAPVVLPAVTQEELVNYTCGFALEPSRRKMVSALAAFFGYLYDIRDIDVDPARHLSRETRKALLDRELLVELRRVGVTAKQARELSWRDVAIAVLGRPGSPALRNDLRLSEQLQRSLTEELLQRLQATDADRLGALLDNTVIQYGIS